MILRVSLWTCGGNTGTREAGGWGVAVPPGLIHCDPHFHLLWSVADDLEGMRMTQSMQNEGGTAQQVWISAEVQGGEPGTAPCNTP